MKINNLLIMDFNCVSMQRFNAESSSFTIKLHARINAEALLTK